MATGMLDYDPTRYMPEAAPLTEDMTDEDRRIAGKNAAARRLVETAEAMPGRYEAAARQASARALAGGLAQGGITGGAALAAGQQAALTAEGSIAEKMGDLEMQAAQGAYEAFAPENVETAAGSEKTAVDAFQASLGGWKDWEGDEESFFDDRLEVLRREQDPNVRWSMGQLLLQWYRNNTTEVGRDWAGYSMGNVTAKVIAAGG